MPRKEIFLDQWRIVMAQLDWAIFVFESPKRVTPQEIDRVIQETPLEIRALDIENLDNNKKKKYQNKFELYQIKRDRFLRSKAYKRRYELFENQQKKSLRNNQ